jgi:hypothetical protein
MMERYKGYWISGTAVPGPPHTAWRWYPNGSVLKSRPNGSVVVVARIKDNGITFDLSGLAVWYGMELSRIAVDNCWQNPRWF